MFNGQWSMFIFFRTFALDNSKKTKKKSIMECTSFDELLDAEYGKRGTDTRERFEADAEAFCLAECLKEQRVNSKL